MQLKLYISLFTIKSIFQACTILSSLSTFFFPLFSLIHPKVLWLCANFLPFYNRCGTSQLLAHFQHSSMDKISMWPNTNHKKDVIDILIWTDSYCECRKVGHILYKIEWYNLPGKVVLDLILVINMSRHPIQITGRLISLSFANLGNVSIIRFLCSK